MESNCPRCGAQIWGNCTCQHCGNTIPSVRTFATGATRDTNHGKLDYEAFTSPAVVKRYAEFMHKNRLQKDGSLRDGDNWQHGFTIESYEESLYRHCEEARQNWRGMPTADDLQGILCAILFNASGLLFELLQAEGKGGERPK